MFILIWKIRPTKKNSQNNSKEEINKKKNCSFVVWWNIFLINVYQFLMQLFLQSLMVNNLIAVENIKNNFIHFESYSIKTLIYILIRFNDEWYKYNFHICFLNKFNIFL